EIIGAYSEFGDHPTANDIRPILDTMVEQYRTVATDEVVLFFTEHVSNISQVAKQIPVLPASFNEGDAPEGQPLTDVTFEPSVTEVLENVTERLLEVQIWQAMLESIASEHSMRMLSMKNATDNAGEIIDDLTLEF